MCMLPLEMQNDFTGETPEYPKIHVSTGEESSGFGTDSTQDLRPRHQGDRIPRGPRATRMGTGLS